MSDLTKIDDTLDSALKQWSVVICDPAISAETSAADSSQRDITGVSVSFAGEWLPRGRVTKTNVSKKRLNGFLRGVGLVPTTNRTAESYWRKYGDLYLYLYWKLYDRNAAIAYRLLHGANGAKSLQFDLSPSDEDPSITTSNGGTQVIRLGQLAKHLLLPEAVAGSFAKELFNTRIESHPPQEELHELANDLGSRLKAPNGCLSDYLPDTEIFVRAELARPERKTFTDDLLIALCLGESDGSLRQRIQQATRMFQLLFLYQPLGGSHVHIFCPEGDINEVRTSFVAWSDTALDVEAFGRLSDASNDLLKKIVTTLKADRKASSSPSTVLGTTISLARQADLDKTMPDDKRQWLGQYLVLCERLADVAVHEGKKLGFTFFVSDGEAASREVEFVSSLASRKETLRWKVCNELVALDGCDEVVSLLLGNYSFLQRTDTVIQATRQGYLLALGSLLPKQRDEKQRDEAKRGFERLTNSHDDLYVIRIEKNRDIKVFFHGKLVLWRRGARWVVPRQFGKDYVEGLGRNVCKILGLDAATAEGNLANQICECAWELSHDEVGGACFMISKSLSSGIKNKLVKMTDVLPFAEGRNLLTSANRGILRDLAIQDGATFIDLANGKVYGRRQIAVAMTNAKWETKLKNLKETWTDWHKTKRWGTRHLNALRAALHLQGEAALLTVSSDGDIHLFGENGPIEEATYP